MVEEGTASHPVVIVGGGPAGMMAGVLLARAGVPVTVLEKHADFFRDFRGDTVHPSTLEIFHQLGWLQELLEIPHSRIDEISVRIAGDECRIVDFRHLDLAAPYVAMMPQWDLLDFLAEKGRDYPTFALRMQAEAIGVTADRAGRISAVELASGEVIPARLVIAADGRRSVLRDAAHLPLTQIGAPMDVFWFRLDKLSGGDQASFGTMAAGKFLVTIERSDYFQCAYLFRKGGAAALRQRGIGQFRQDLASLLPDMERSIAALQDWDQVKLLDVALDRLERWHSPGLLAIGDAAHAMSPIGGVGINVAVQDAVAMANILAEPLARGADPDPLLAQVQAHRWKAVTRMQAMQKFVQDRVIEPVLARKKPITRPFLPVRLLNAIPPLRRIPARIIGLGFDPVQIESEAILRG
ncbi:FAD-dependent oxidoreductase [Aurantiacibacter rhizosphaerae]|uniref:FAD-dependent oxidoreductase n=1 Tax=Aurantiacibacter rhizosphaerae TaxID=2691582 RepID=A0A844XFM3_9SPHN|nr:FAD-dependent oxidoreductase [Aurantiacibacter rhizosphaerae]MWV28325.1 FAD-dependent oxidoreductase [Aurantiacibacter rhizosphaerae]